MIIIMIIIIIIHHHDDNYLNETGVSCLLKAASDARLHVDSSKCRDLSQHPGNLLTIIRYWSVLMMMMRMIMMTMMTMIVS